MESKQHFIEWRINETWLKVTENGENSPLVYVILSKAYQGRWLQDMAACFFSGMKGRPRKEDIQLPPQFHFFSCCEIASWLLMFAISIPFITPEIKATKVCFQEGLHDMQKWNHTNAR